MKFKIFITTLFSLNIVAVHGQIVINSNDYPLGENSSYSYSGKDTALSPGEGGENRLWDFSSITATTLSNYTSYDCGANSLCDSFTGANYYNTNNTDNYSSFYRKSNSGIYLNGYYKDMSSYYVMNDFSNSRQILKFPLQYNTSFIDTFASVVTYQNITSFAEGGTYSAVVDGYGTLKTPAGTYTGVLRVKAIMSITSNGVPYLYTYYYWYQAGIAGQLMEISQSYIVNQGPSNTTYSYKFINTPPKNQTAINELLNLASLINIYPNPAHDEFKLAFNRKAQCAITLKSLLGADVYRINVSGEEQITINVSGWPRGVYLLIINDGSNGRFSQKIVVE